MDLLRAMVVAFRQDIPLPDATPLIRRLTALAQQTLDKSPKDTQATPQGGEVIVALNIFIKPECPMPAALAFQAYLTMSRYGEVVGAGATRQRNSGGAIQISVGCPSGVNERISRIVGQLQEALTHTRMVPLGVVFGRFPRLVRELARATGKRVQLRVEGEDTEIDRALVERLNECLIHLVRNALDHGIEPPDERIAAGKPPEGVVELRASQSEGSVIIVVRDDGRGIVSRQRR